jgi:hypothetical protein
MVVSDRLALAVMVGMLAVGGVWVWSSESLRETSVPESFGLEEKRRPEPAPAIAGNPSPAVSEVIPVRELTGQARSGTPTETPPVFAVPPVLADVAVASLDVMSTPADEESLDRATLTETEELAVTSGAIDAPAAGEPESAAVIGPARALPDRDFAAKAPSRSRGGQTASQPAIDDIGPQPRGKLSPRSRDYARRTDPVQARSRPRTARHRLLFGFRWSGPVRNPWESPARTGFNQK